MPIKEQRSAINVDIRSVGSRWKERMETEGIAGSQLITIGKRRIPDDQTKTSKDGTTNVEGGVYNKIGTVSLTVRGSLSRKNIDRKEGGIGL